MPLFISPASAHRAVPVVLTNTLGKPIVFRVTLSRCSGKTSYTSGPLTLANGAKYTVPSGGPHDPMHRVVTFTVQGTGGQVAASASLTSDQGCTAAGVAKARTQALTAPQGHTGSLQVTPAAQAGSLPDLIGAVALILAVLLVPVAVWRRKRRAKRIRALHVTLGNEGHPSAVARHIAGKHSR